MLFSSVTVTEANVDMVSLITVFPIALRALTCRESASQGFSKTSGPECPLSICTFYQTIVWPIQDTGKKMPDSVCFSQTPCIRLLTDGEHVEDGADDGHEEDRAKLVEEEPVGHEVAGLPNDWRQEEEEEDVRGERDHVLVVVRQEEHNADEQTNQDQDARLGEVVLDAGSLLKTCRTNNSGLKIFVTET